MKKALLTATVQSHIAQFHRPLIKILKEEGYEVHVAAHDNLAEKNGLQIENIDKKFDIPFARSPFKLQNIKVFFMLKKIIKRENYEIISCNTPVGGLVTRLAANSFRKKGSRVFYTAHGFHFYQGAPKKNWLIYYPIEKAMAKLTDILITITKEDEQLAKKKFRVDIRHIYGVGADEKKYMTVSAEETQAFRRKMGYDQRVTILCTGELNENKNQITLIRAMKTIVNKHPEALLLLAGNGPKEAELKKSIQEFGLEKHITLLGYHTDLEKYVNAADIVASVSFREGMPLNIMEAMICGKPVVASYNRGHRELIQNGKNGYLAEPNSVEEISNKIIKLIENEETRKHFSENAKQMVQPYLMRNVELDLRKIYL